MSNFATELPEVIVKPGKIMTTSKIKALVVLMALLIYVYVIIYIKTLYMKSKRLDRLQELVLVTDKKMQNIHNLDHQLSEQLSQFEDLYDY